VLKYYNRTRLYIIFLFLISSFLFLALRLSYLQILNQDFFLSYASRQHNFLVERRPKRGLILDRNGRELAFNIDLESVYAQSRLIKDKERVARDLSGILDLSEEFILERLKRDKLFVWICRKISPEQAREIKKLRHKGIKFVKEPKRCYPNNELACHVIGFTDIDNNGLEGLELVFDRHLKGRPGWCFGTKDAKQRQLFHKDTKELPPVDGSQIVLTIDETIQSIAERELAKAYKKYRAKSASMIVMDPFTGDILAMANMPAYDPNNPGDYDTDERRNRAITDVYEPGSVFKVITAAAAINDGSVKPEDDFFCENGEHNFGGHILHDHRQHGHLSFRDVIVKSSNIGTSKAAVILGEEKLYEYIDSFGFGRPTGVRLPGEVSGISRHYSDWSGYSISSIPIGHEIAVTQLQLACALSAVVNGGYTVKPRIVSQIRDSKGVLLKEFPIQRGAMVISRLTSDTMKDIMRGVVEEGTGKAARLKEYIAGGKTGTAQKVEKDGRYSHRKYIGTFAGFAPLKRPEIVAVVSLKEPRPIYYGGLVAAPVFREAGQEILRYMEVESDTVVMANR
jgi:cell division protein FtsI/penicillin-binding protein 2